MNVLTTPVEASDLVDVIGDDSGELPDPSDDPDIRYTLPGKQYQLKTGEVVEIAAYTPDGPCGGIVAITWVDRDGHPNHESKRKNGGVSREVIEPYIESDELEGGIQTVAMLRNDVADLRMLEEDTRKYDDLHWEWVRGQTAEANR